VRAGVSAAILKSMSDKPVHVEIVTPVYNRRETTLQCLRSLARIDRTGLKVHIIVVDDGSRDGTSEAIREQHPDVQIVRGDGTLHYTAGTNRGIEAALEHSPDYVLAINDDSIFDEQFLGRLVACAEENAPAVVGPLLLLWDQPHQVFQIGSYWDTWYGGWRYRQKLTAWTVPQHPFDVEVVVGNCVLYPVKAIQEIGLMKEKKFPFGFGDVEYTPRMRRAGWRLLIEPRSRVWCEPNRDLASPSKMSAQELFRTLFKDYRNPYNLKRQFVSRWESAPTRAHALAAYAILLVRLACKYGRIGTWPNWPDEELNGKRS
jgi:GT2 family glycosyltransferase